MFKLPVIFFFQLRYSAGYIGILGIIMLRFMPLSWRVAYFLLAIFTVLILSTLYSMSRVYFALCAIKVLDVKASKERDTRIFLEYKKFGYSYQELKKMSEIYPDWFIPDTVSFEDYSKKISAYCMREKET